MGGRGPTIKDARKKILEAQRERLNLPADTPSVKYRHQRCCSLEVEPFPESLRLGCETYAIDFNPVAHIIELCTGLSQSMGRNYDEVEKWVIGNENVRW